MVQIDLYRLTHYHSNLPRFLCMSIYIYIHWSVEPATFVLYAGVSRCLERYHGQFQYIESTTRKAT